MWNQSSAVVPVRDLIQQFDTRAFTLTLRHVAAVSTPAKTEAEVAAALARSHEPLRGRALQAASPKKNPAGDGRGK